MKKIITLTILTSILATHFTTTQALGYKTKMYLGFGTAVVGGVSGAVAAIYFYNKAKNSEDETDPEFKKQQQMIIRQYKALAWLCGIGGVALAAGGTLYGIRQKNQGPMQEQLKERKERKEEVEAALEKLNPDEKIQYLITQIESSLHDSPARYWAINRAYSIIEAESSRVDGDIIRQVQERIPQDLEGLERLDLYNQIEAEIKRGNKEYNALGRVKTQLDQLSTS